MYALVIGAQSDGTHSIVIVSSRTCNLFARN